MSGSFPTRPIADDFGGPYRDTYPPENPETDVGADSFFNRVRWQISGAGLIVPRGLLIAEWNSGTSSFDITEQDEAWNPNRNQNHPVLGRSSAGKYTYTLASTYHDKDGNDVSVFCYGAACFPQQTRSGGYAWPDATDAKIIHLETYDIAGAGYDDLPFVLVFW